LAANLSDRQREAPSGSLPDRDTLRSVQKVENDTRLFSGPQNENFNLTGYDDALVRQLIKNVKIISETKIRVTFKGGFDIEQEL